LRRGPDTRGDSGAFYTPDLPALSSDFCQPALESAQVQLRPASDERRVGASSATTLTSASFSTVVGPTYGTVYRGVAYVNN